MTNPPITPAGTFAVRPEILLEESAWIRRLAWSLVGNEATAEDITQDVLTVAITDAPALPKGQLRGWLATITRRLASRSRTREANRIAIESYAAQPEVEQRGAKERLDLHRKLMDSVDNLGEPYRTALVMRYFDELSAREIGARLNITEATARKRVSRGLALLREDLDGNHEGGRTEWLAALLPIALPPSGSAHAVEISLAQLAQQSMLTLAKAKVALVASIAVLCALFAWKAFTAPHLGVNLEPQNTSARGSELNSRLGVAPGSAVSEGSGLGTAVERIAVAPVATALGTIRVVGARDSRLDKVRLAWIDSNSKVHALHLDKDGVAHRPEGSGTARFFAYAAGEGTAFAAGGPIGEDVLLSLVPGRTVRGRIVEDGGIPSRPLALNAQRSTYLSGLNEGESDLRKALENLGAIQKGKLFVRTQADGTFVIRDVPMSMASSLQIPATHVFFEEYRQGQPAALNRFPFHPNDPDLVLNLARLPSVYGRALWSDDRSPASGAIWSLATSAEDGSFFEMQYAAIEKDGTFGIPLPMKVDATLLSPEMRGASVAASSLQLGSATPAHFGIRKGPTSLHFRKANPLVTLANLEDMTYPIETGILLLERPYKVHLQIMDPDGVPVPGAIVASSNTSATSNSKGEVHLSCTPGDILQALAPGFSLATLEAPLHTPGGGQIQVLTLRPGVSFTVDLGDLSGSGFAVELKWEVTPFEGVPRQGLSIYEPLPIRIHEAVHGAGLRGGQWDVSKPGAPGTGAFSVPANGKLTIPGLRPGATFQVRLTDLLGQLVAENHVTLPANGASLVLPMSVDRGAFSNLHVRIVDTAGTLIEASSVFMYEETGASGSRYDSSGGTRVLTPIKMGTYRVIGRALGHVPQELGAFVLHETDQKLEFKLESARKIKVTCMDQRGEAMVPHSIHLESANGWQAHRTNPQGASSWFLYAPREDVTVIAKVGTREFRTTATSDVREVTLSLPRPERFFFEVRKPDFVTTERAILKILVEELRTGTTAEFSSIFGADDVGSLHCEGNLHPGSYAVHVVVDEWFGEEVETHSILQDHFEIHEGARNSVQLGQ